MLLVWPLARLTDRVALAVWVGVGLLLGVGASLASVRALGWRVRALPALIVVLYLVAWAPSAAFTMTAQISFFVMAPVCAAWLAYRRGAAHAGRALARAGRGHEAVPARLPAVLPPAARPSGVRRDGARDGAVRRGAASLSSEPAAYADWLGQLPRITWSAHYLNASIMGVVQRVDRSVRASRLSRARRRWWCR